MSPKFKNLLICLQVGCVFRFAMLPMGFWFNIRDTKYISACNNAGMVIISSEEDITGAGSGKLNKVKKNSYCLKILPEDGLTVIARQF